MMMEKHDLDELECLKISSAIGDTSFWKIEHEWLKPGIKESAITAKVNEYLYEHGFDFVYDIIVASGGNTSPYRRWHTDKVIREGDLVIVDQNASGPEATSSTSCGASRSAADGRRRRRISTRSATSRCTPRSNR
jgi:Xaa-Pro aminopeptidase